MTLSCVVFYLRNNFNCFNLVIQSKRLLSLFVHFFYVKLLASVQVLSVVLNALYFLTGFPG